MSSTMRAVLIKNDKGSVDSLYLGETQTPVPRPGEVLVKIKAFGLNRMDILQREGYYPLPKGISTILGVEFSGTVEALGPGAGQKWSTGDEVFGLAYGGAYAEYIACPATMLLAKPTHLSWVEAAGIPENFLTAFQSLLLLADLKADENVLIHAGASGVGVAAIQLARVSGAKNVIATASTQEKLDFVARMPHGATRGVNYKTQDFSAEVKAATEGKGVDVLIDFVGGSHWAKNLDSLGLDGRMVVLALMGGMTVPDCNLLPILLKRLHIMGSTLRSRSVEYQAQLIARFEKETLNKITGKDGDGDLRVYIHKVYPWSKIQDAHREMEANANIGKIVVEVN